MRITALEIEGFRSIRKVSLTEKDLGRVIVLYGENGAGKSNIVAAIDKLWRLLRLATLADARPDRKIPFDPIGLLSRADVHKSEAAGRMRFAATLDFGDAPLVLGELRAEKLAVAISVVLPEATDAPKTIALDSLVYLTPGPAGEPRNVDIRSLSDSAAQTLWPVVETNAPINLITDVANDYRAHILALTEFGLLTIPATRDAPKGDPVPANLPDATRATRHALNGELAAAFAIAHNSIDLELQDRLRALTRKLSETPLERPELRSVTVNGQPAIVEVHRAGQHVYPVPFDLVGTGLQRIYAVLGSILLSRADIVVVEEPEAHLHGPSSGLKLRTILQSLVKGAPDHQRAIDQLFIVTHSPLFDLDTDGFLEVTWSESTGTVVNRKGLVALDRRHAYEVGPARHALMEALSLGDGDRIAYRDENGAPILAREMLQKLEDHDPIAITYLDDITSAAVRAVGLRAEKLP